MIFKANFIVITDFQLKKSCLIDLFDILKWMKNKKAFITERQLQTIETQYVYFKL